MERGRNLLAVVPGSFVSGAELLLLRDLEAARNAGWAAALRAATDHSSNGSQPRASSASRFPTFGSAKGRDHWLRPGSPAQRSARRGHCDAIRGPPSCYSSTASMRSQQLRSLAAAGRWRCSRTTCSCGATASRSAHVARRAVRGTIAVSDAAAEPLPHAGHHGEGRAPRHRLARAPRAAERRTGTRRDRGRAQRVEGPSRRARRVRARSSTAT